MSAPDADGLPLNVLVRLLFEQERLGWLSDETLAAISGETKTPLYALGAVTSFYPHFRRTPPPRHVVLVCRDAACHIEGAEALLDGAKRGLSSLADVEVKGASCLGRCDAAPAAAVDDVPVGGATEALLCDLARDRSPLPADEPTTTPRRWATDPYPPGMPRYGALRKVLSGGEKAALEVPAILSAAGLMGMGGAGFPTGRKWDLVRKAAGSPKYVVCNADESEPGTFKDRVILEELPHLVLEGMLLAATVVGAKTAIVYLRHEYSREKKALAREIENARREGVLSAAGVDVSIFTSPGGYILGEETALLEALEGRRGEPRNKPPYPGTHGLYGKPTLVNNVETLAHVPRILFEGAEAWRARGIDGAAGLKFVSVCGDVERPTVLEIPAGTKVSEAIGRAGGVRGGKPLLAFSPGGASTAFLPASKADTPLSWDALKAAGSALGSGALFVLAEGRDLLDVATNVVRFFRNESCGKCVPCRVGSTKAVEVLERVLAGKAPASDLETLHPLHETLAVTSICGLGQVALVPAISAMAHSPAGTARTRAGNSGA